MFRSFENNLIRELDSRGNTVTGDYYTGDEEFDNKIAKGWNEVRPKYGQFLKKDANDNLYNKEEIERDRELVNKIKRQDWFIQERNKQAIALEYIAMEGIHNQGWLGEASVTPTLSHDDVVGGIDMVVRFDRINGEPLFLGIDTTTSLNESIIEHKLQRTVDDLTEHKLSEVKYFIDDQTAEKKHLQLPRVILNISAENVEELIPLMMKKSELIKTDKIQTDALDEIINQLSFGLEFLKQEQANDQLIATYQQLLDHLTKIRKEKSPTKENKSSRANGVLTEALDRLREKVFV